MPARPPGAVESAARMAVSCIHLRRTDSAARRRLRPRRDRRGYSRARRAGSGDEHDGGRRRLRLSFPDQWMSTRHARIERTIGGFWVTDEDSKNGLLLNGERTRNAFVVDGDWIEAGHTVLRYRHGVLPPSRQPRDSRSTSDAALSTVLPTLGEQLRDSRRSLARRCR